MSNTVVADRPIDGYRLDLFEGPDGIQRLPVELPLDDLVVGDSIRGLVICEERVAALMSDSSHWPPIVVRRDDGSVVDGRHRIVAARRLGHSHIPAMWFDGTAREAFVEFVRLNRGDVFGLSASERHEAVRRVLHNYPEWADRRIGELCGISPKTVAQVRSRLSASCVRGGPSTSEFRVGRDGRSRPVDAAAQRAKIVTALKEQPSASLRAIAAQVGVSPETVRRVKSTLGESAHGNHNTPPAVDMLGLLIARNQRPAGCPDLAFESREDSEVTADFLQRTDVTEVELPIHAGAVPLSRVYEVADEARRRAAFWSRLADRVEGRARRSKR